MARDMAKNASPDLAAMLLNLAKSYDELAEMVEHSLSGRRG
jgi:hypothetical protein